MSSQPFFRMIAGGAVLLAVALLRYSGQSILGYPIVTFSAAVPLAPFNVRVSIGHLVLLPGAAAPGAFSFAGFSTNGVTLFVFNASGVEVSRALVPEPSTAALLALGLCGVAAGRTVWRWRERRSA